MTTNIWQKGLQIFDRDNYKYSTETTTNIRQNYKLQIYNTNLKLQIWLSVRILVVFAGLIFDVFCRNFEFTVWLGVVIFYPIIRWLNRVYVRTVPFEKKKRTSHTHTDKEIFRLSGKCVNLHILSVYNNYNSYIYLSRQ